VWVGEIQLSAADVAFKVDGEEEVDGVAVRPAAVPYPIVVSDGVFDA
jgi:hypothetical protein